MALGLQRAFSDAINLKLSSARLEHSNTRRQTVQPRRWQSADSRSEGPLCQAGDSCRIHPELGGTNGEGIHMGGHPPRVFRWEETNVPTFATSRTRRSTRNFATDRLGNPLPRMGDRGNVPQAENQFHVLVAASTTVYKTCNAQYRPLC